MLSVLQESRERTSRSCCLDTRAIVGSRSRPLGYLFGFIYDFSQRTKYWILERSEGNRLPSVRYRRRCPDEQAHSNDDQVLGRTHQVVHRQLCLLAESSRLPRRLFLPHGRYIQLLRDSAVIATMVSRSYPQPQDTHLLRVCDLL